MTLLSKLAEKNKRRLFWPIHKCAQHIALGHGVESTLKPTQMIHLNS